MNPSDQSYYQRRAEDEVSRAQTADHPQAVAAHYQLAEAYLAKAGALQQDRQEKA